MFWTHKRIQCYNSQNRQQKYSTLNRSASHEKKLTAIAATVGFLCCASTGLSEEITYRKHIQPLFERQCARCHGEGAAPEYRLFKEDSSPWTAQSKSIRMNTYSHMVSFTGWPNTGALMRRLDDGASTADGKPGNMHENLGATQEERQRNLALFKQWVGAWSLKRWPEATKEEISAIRVPY